MSTSLMMQYSANQAAGAAGTSGGQHEDVRQLSSTQRTVQPSWSVWRNSGVKTVTNGDEMEWSLDAYLGDGLVNGLCWGRVGPSDNLGLDRPAGKRQVSRVR